MSLIKKILLGLLIVFIAIQLVRPTRNSGEGVLSNDFGKVYSVPGDVETLLQEACYDCHSNHTNYPWYTHVQPVGWMMAKHIRQGKAELNLSEFGNYTARRQLSKLRGMASQIIDGEMPLSSYQLMHSKARLSPEEKARITEWMQQTVDSLSRN